MSDTTTTAPAPLWPKPIPIIGGTGDKGHGKTRFGLSICPGPQTLVYDLEQSSASYDYIGFERIDVQKEMHAKHPKGYKPVQLFTWWLDHIRSIPAGKYRVIMVDPVTDLEAGLADWVEANPQAFGHTAGQYASMSGIKWGDVKNHEKLVLADICARCECFYFTAHIGTEFKGGKATDQKKAKGKETLFELASLYLWFERKPDSKGAVPNIPAAKVIKSRLEIGNVVDGEVYSFSVLPPRLEQATPGAIRKYFTSPAGGRPLQAGELAPEERLSEDEKLRLRAQIAADEAIAAQARGANSTGGGVVSGSSPQGDGQGRQTSAPPPVESVKPVEPAPIANPAAIPTPEPSTNGIHTPPEPITSPPPSEPSPRLGTSPAAQETEKYLAAGFRSDIAAAADIKALKVVGDAIGKATREGSITKEHREELNPIYAVRFVELKGGAGAPAAAKS